MSSTEKKKVSGLVPAIVNHKNYFVNETLKY